MAEAEYLYSVIPKKKIYDYLHATNDSNVNTNVFYAH